MARSPPSITLTSAVVIADRYHLKRQIAAGGMGTVWAALDAKLSRDVAIKVLAKQLASHSDLLTRFEREAKAVAQLRSAHVVEVYDFGIHDGLPFIVMELLEGESLRTRLRREGQLDLRETLVITDQIAKGLKVAHHAGLIHRDLKPSNVFLAQADDAEVVKLLDFGVVKAVDQSGSTDMTASGTLLGTPQYMSPEQVRARRQIDHRSDLWALGVIAFRCLTGINPFRGESVGDAALRICSDDLPRLSEYSDHLPRELDRFFDRAFARDPAERFQSAEELAREFRSYCAFVLSDVSLSAAQVGSALVRTARAVGGEPATEIELPGGLPVGPSVTPPSMSGISAVPGALRSPDSGTPPPAREAVIAVAAGGGREPPSAPGVALPMPRPPGGRRVAGAAGMHALGLGRAGVEGAAGLEVTKRYVAPPPAGAAGLGGAWPATPAGTPVPTEQSASRVSAEAARVTAAVVGAPADDSEEGTDPSLAAAPPAAAIPGTSIPLPAAMEAPGRLSLLLDRAELRALLQGLRRRLVRWPVPALVATSLATLVGLVFIGILLMPSSPADGSSPSGVARLGRWTIALPASPGDEHPGIEETTGVLATEEPESTAPPVAPGISVKPSPDKRGTTPPSSANPKEPRPKWF